MRTLAQLSDLHFGRTDPLALAPLRDCLRRLAPDLVLVCGDLTQRARASQFRAARAFLDSLPGRWLGVPGNHDVPLYNVAARFLRPLHGFRRELAADPEPAFLDEEIAVLGVNTARSFVFKGGRVSARQLERVQRAFGALDGRTRIVFAHHPLAPLRALAEHGVDVLMSGHLHASRVERLAPLVVHAGTATSRRRRAEPNAFNVLRVDPGEVLVERYVLGRGAFGRAAAERFERSNGAWQRVSAERILVA